MAWLAARFGYLSRRRRGDIDQHQAGGIAWISGRAGNAPLDRRPVRAAQAGAIAAPVLRMVVDAVPTWRTEHSRHHHTAVGTLSAIPKDRLIVHAFARQLVALLYFMAPAYLANMAPPFVRYWKGWNRPINERLLGSHKTVIGFALGVVAGVLATGVQAALALPISRLDYAAWPLLGLGFGLGAMAGDSLKSLLKRRLGITPGWPWVPFDQIDFVFGALLLVAPWARLSWFEVLLILIGSFLAGLLVNRLAFRLGIKDSPW